MSRLRDQPFIDLIINPERRTLNTEHLTLNPERGTRNTEHGTLNAEP